MKALISILKMKHDHSDGRSSFMFYYINHSLYSIRLAFILGFVLYGAFSFLDVYMAPDSKHQIWFIRFGVVMPVLAIALVLSFYKRFIYYGQAALLIVSLVIDFGVLAIILC